MTLGELQGLRDQAARDGGQRGEEGLVEVGGCARNQTANMGARRTRWPKVESPRGGVLRLALHQLRLPSQFRMAMRTATPAST